jgi:hypothetical protein
MQDPAPKTAEVGLQSRTPAPPAPTGRETPGAYDAFVQEGLPEEERLEVEASEPALRLRATDTGFRENVDRLG